MAVARKRKKRDKAVRVQRIKVSECETNQPSTEASSSFWMKAPDSSTNPFGWVVESLVQAKRCWGEQPSEIRETVPQVVSWGFDNADMADQVLQVPTSPVSRELTTAITIAVAIRFVMLIEGFDPRNSVDQDRVMTMIREALEEVLKEPPRMIPDVPHEQN
jgi:hypothetical protein